MLPWSSSTFEKVDDKYANDNYCFYRLVPLSFSIDFQNCMEMHTCKGTTTKKAGGLLAGNKCQELITLPYIGVHSKSISWQVEPGCQ